MKILFTGASSFTGSWFVKDLAGCGEDITTIFTRNSIEEYSGMRLIRVKQMLKCSNTIFGCTFGDEKFSNLIKSNNFDVICHHSSYVLDYKNEDFSIIGALQSNTNNSNQIIKDFASQSGKGLVFTGSVFEKNEGVGSDNRAFSPYGLSKGMSSDILEYYCNSHGVRFGKFVISNPFGPYEDPKFTTYLIKEWLNNKVAMVNTPLYVRDNIHISLLAKIYSKYIQGIYNDKNTSKKINPSGYVEAQSDFTLRFAGEVRKRTSLDCKYELKNQTIMQEPRVRINIDPAKYTCEWDESKAWDELVEFYKDHYFHNS